MPSYQKKPVFYFGSGQRGIYLSVLTFFRGKRKSTISGIMLAKRYSALRQGPILKVPLIEGTQRIYKGLCYVQPFH